MTELLRPEEVREMMEHVEEPVHSETIPHLRLLCQDYLILHDLWLNEKERWEEHELTCSDLYYERSVRHD